MVPSAARLTEPGVVIAWFKHLHPRSAVFISWVIFTKQQSPYADPFVIPKKLKAQFPIFPSYGIMFE
jgi:hypothetical protein